MGLSEVGFEDDKLWDTSIYVHLKVRLFQNFEGKWNRKKREEAKYQQQGKTPAKKKQKVRLFSVDSDE